MHCMQAACGTRSPGSPTSPARGAGPLLSASPFWPPTTCLLSTAPSQPTAPRAQSTRLQQGSAFRYTSIRAQRTGRQRTSSPGGVVAQIARHLVPQHNAPPVCVACRQLITHGVAERPIPAHTLRIGQPHGCTAGAALTRPRQILVPSALTPPAPRPFPIIIASVRSNLSHAATFYPVEFTPEYVGVPTAATYSVQLNSPGGHWWRLCGACGESMGQASCFRMHSSVPAPSQQCSVAQLLATSSPAVPPCASPLKLPSLLPLLPYHHGAWHMASVAPFSHL